MNRLKPDKLHVRMGCEASSSGLPLPRRYTLTHSDRTGDLFLTIDAQYDRGQISGCYTRVMRDEVLAEWLPVGNEYALHVHCHVSGGLVFGTAAWREAIFRRELPLVLKALRYGDRALYDCHPDLSGATVVVHFHRAQSAQDKAEEWGVIGNYDQVPPAGG